MPKLHSNAYWRLMCDFGIAGPVLMYSISKNPNVTWKIICAFPNGMYKSSTGISNIPSKYAVPIRWASEGIARNPNITIQILLDFPNGPPGADVWVWDWSALSSRIPICDIEAHSELPWCRDGLRLNPDIDIRRMKELHDNLWVNVGPKITWTDVVANPHIKWRLDTLAANPSVTPEIVDNNPFGPYTSSVFCWCFDSMSRNPNITPEFVEKHRLRPWNWEYIVKNQSFDISRYMNPEMRKYIGSSPYITCEVAKGSFLYFYSYFEDMISDNPNINPQFIRNSGSLPHKWNWIKLAFNPMNGPFWAKSTAYQMELAMRCSAAIKGELLAVTMHPSRPFASWMTQDELRDISKFGCS